MLNSFFLIFAIMATSAVRGTASSQLIAEEHCSSDTFHLRCPALGFEDGSTGSGPAAPPSRVGGGESEVIVIHRADYGRMRPARRCISAAYAESMGCQADVVEHLHSVCTGRPNCSLLVATMDSVSQPCPKDFKSYVEVVYECITVSFIDDCTRFSHTSTNSTNHHAAATPSSTATRLTTDRGHLALFPNPERPPSAEHTGTSGGCHWLIEAPPGQTIRVAWKLVGGVQPVAASARRHNSGAAAPTGAGAIDDRDYLMGAEGSSMSDSCSVAVMFRDGDRGATVTRAACDGGRPTLRGQREKGPTESRRPHPVFVSDKGIYRSDDDDDGDQLDDDFDGDAGIFFQSKSNRLEIHPAVSSADPLVSNDVGRTVADQWKPYILQYKFVGCEDLTPPSDDVYMERAGDVTTITCRGEDGESSDESRESWQLTCQKGAWFGEIGNCSKPALLDTRFSSVRPGQQSYTDIRNGVVLAVLIGIFLGVTVGACLMMIVFVAKNRGSKYFKHDPVTTDAVSPAVAQHFHVELRGGGDPYELRRTAAIAGDPGTCTPTSTMGIYRSPGTCCDCAGAVVMTMPFTPDADGSVMPQLSSSASCREQMLRRKHHHQPRHQSGPLPPPPPSVVMTSYTFNRPTVTTQDDAEDATPPPTTNDVQPMSSFYSGRTTQVGGFYAPSGSRSTGFRCPSDASSDCTPDTMERIGVSAGTRPSTASTCYSVRSNDANSSRQSLSRQTVAPTTDRFAFDLLRHGDKSTAK